MRQIALAAGALLALTLAACAADGAPTRSTAPAAEGAGRKRRFARQTTASGSPPKKAGKSKKSFEVECLAAHNKWRRLHSAPDLVYDKKIAAFAQKRADFIAASDGAEFKHPKDLIYGENLAWHSTETRPIHELVRMWYDEVELYNFSEPKFTHETGHFTQLVWRSTERVGCGKAVSGGKNGGVYLVCNYDPPGNWVGEERDNVLAASQVDKKRKGVAKASRDNDKPAASTTTTSTTTTTTTSTTTSTTPAPTTKRPPTALTSSWPRAMSVDSTSVGPLSGDGASTTTPGPKRKKKSKGKKKKGKGKKKGNKKKKKKPTTSSTTSTTTTTISPSSTVPELP